MLGGVKAPHCILINRPLLNTSCTPRWANRSLHYLSWASVSQKARLAVVIMSTVCLDAWCVSRGQSAFKNFSTRVKIRGINLFACESLNRHDGHLALKFLDYYRETNGYADVSTDIAIFNKVNLTRKILGVRRRMYFLIKGLESDCKFYKNIINRNNTNFVTVIFCYYSMPNSRYKNKAFERLLSETYYMSKKFWHTDTLRKAPFVLFVFYYFLYYLLIFIYIHFRFSFSIKIKFQTSKTEC